MLAIGFMIIFQVNYVFCLIHFLLMSQNIVVRLTLHPFLKMYVI